MERNQRQDILKRIISAYPNFFQQKTEWHDPKAKAELWNNFLKEWDYEKTKKRLMEHVETSPYEPKISEIKPNTYKPDYSWKDGLYDD